MKTKNAADVAAADGKPSATLRGAVRIHPNGFSFLDSSTDSVYIDANRTRDLVDGDIVDVTYDGDPGRYRARTVSVVERPRRRVAGVVNGNRCVADPHIAHRSWRLSASGHRLSDGDVVIGDLDGDTFTVTGVAGNELDALRHRLLARHHVEHRDPSHTGRRHRRAAQRRSRTDLRELTTVTIDADTSADLDDAVSAHAGDNGTVTVYVHISDVTDIVTAGSELDQHAAAAATSVYLPGWTRPMLPRSLSERSLSLLAGTDRDTLTVEMSVSGDGTVTSCDIYESTIRSNGRLSYTLTQQLLAGSGNSELAERVDDPDAVLDTISWLRCAAGRLASQRRRRGTDDPRSDAPELRVADSELPTLDDIVEPDGADEAHELIEVCMVAANEAVAEWLTDRDLPALYRHHPAPDTDAAAELAEFCAALGYRTAFGDQLDPHALAALREQLRFASNGHRAAIDDKIRSLLTRAEYRPDRGDHFGLGSTNYLHFTSPIRRYADMCVHRIVKAHLHHSAETLPDSGQIAHLNTAAANAARCETQMRRTLWLAAVDAAGPQHRWTATITSISDRGVHAQLDGTALRVKVRGRTGHVDAGTTTLDGRRVTVGDTVDVTVSDIDTVAGAITVKLAGGNGNGRRRRNRRRAA